MNAAALISFTSALFVILNPIGNIAILAGMVASQDTANVPIAMPIIAGPGAMVTVIVNAPQYKGLLPVLAGKHMVSQC